LRAIADLPKTIEEKRKTMIEDSQRMIGVPYVWGGTSGNGIDCSGFTRLLHRWVGVQIPRDADMQHEAAKPVEPPYEVGDLFFFAENDSNRKITHVGLCLGGWTVIHSSRTNNGVYINDLQQRKQLMIFLSAPARSSGKHKIVPKKIVIQHSLAPRICQHHAAGGRGAS